MKLSRVLNQSVVAAVLAVTFAAALCGCEASKDNQSRNLGLEGIWHSNYEGLILTADSMIWEEREGRLTSTGRYEVSGESIRIIYRPTLEREMEGQTLSARFALDENRLHLIINDDTTLFTRSAITPEELLGPAMPCANQTGAWYATVDLYPGEDYSRRGKRVLYLHVPVRNAFTGREGFKQLGNSAVQATVSLTGRIHGLNSTGLGVECREGSFQPALREDGRPRNGDVAPIIGGWDHVTYKGDRYRPIQPENTDWVLFGIIDIPHSTSSSPTSEAVIEAFQDVRTAYRRRIDLASSLLVLGRDSEMTDASELYDLEAAADRATQNKLRVTSVLDGASVQDYIDVQVHLGAAMSAFLVETHESPDLRSGAAFQDLMAQLEETENRINVARRDYNAAVSRHNETVRNTGRGQILSSFSAGARAEQAPEVSFD